MIFPFLNGGGSKSNRDSYDLSELNDFFLSEEGFNGLLALERKRTARTKRPFILALLNIVDFSSGNNGSCALASQFVSCLKATIRNTDTIGWYLCNKEIGILFSEIGDSSTKLAADKIISKVKGSLLKCLKPERANLIRISLFFYPEESGRSSDKSNVEPVLYPDIRHRHSRKKASLFLKRTIDITGGIAILFLSFPVMMIISLLIRLTSKGPVLFKQERIGQLGRKFTFLKFRSMYADNDPTIHKKYICKLINPTTTVIL